jgi:hypothetical protein
MLIYTLLLYILAFIAFSTNTASSIGEGVGSNIAGLILAVFIFVMVFVFIFAAFKIIVTLLKAFINVLLLTIVSPIYITLGILFSDMGFGSWVRSFVSNLAVFPVVGLLFLISWVFLFSKIKSINPGIIPNDLSSVSSLMGVTIDLNSVGNVDGWPPFLSLGKNTMAILFLIVSYEIVVMAPKAAEMISSIMAGKGIGEYGTGLSEAVSGGVGYAIGRRTTALDEEYADRERAYKELESKAAQDPKFKPDADAMFEQMKRVARRKQLEERVGGWFGGGGNVKGRRR